MYDYTGTLLYSAKNHNCRKDGKLKYFKCIEFDGKNLIVEPLLHLPMDMAMTNERTKKNSWYVHNLDVLTGEFKIIFR